MPLLTRRFWKDATERSVKTFAQSTLAALGVGAATAQFQQVPWLVALSVGASAAAISVLTSLASERVGDPDSASLLRGGHADHVHVAQDDA